MKRKHFHEEKKTTFIKLQAKPKQLRLILSIGVKI